MATCSFFQFREVITGGDVIEPPFRTKKDFEIGSEAFVTDQNCLALQITTTADMYISTDGQIATTGDRLLKAGYLATIIFKTPDRHYINTLAA